jgi:hypothetical protein
MSRHEIHLLFITLLLTLFLLFIAPRTASPQAYRARVDTLKGSVWLLFDHDWKYMTPSLLRLPKGHPKPSGATAPSTTNPHKKENVDV